MPIPIYTVNAFSFGPFTGNPAAVCPLEKWLPDNIMQAVAAQNNLSETVFFVEETHHFSIRWFTPTTEVPLCGHATLAAAYIIFTKLNYIKNEIRFLSKSGELKVIKEKDILILNFPVEHFIEVSNTVVNEKQTGFTAIHTVKGRSFILAEVATEEDVMHAQPDFTALKQIDASGIIITAKGTTSDFVSRVFAPQSGIDEDPVTGSAYCILIPYWANKLHKDNLLAKQLSKRGGILHCTYAGSRVLIGGKADLFSSGHLEFTTPNL